MLLKLILDICFVTMLRSRAKNRKIKNKIDAANKKTAIVLVFFAFLKIFFQKIVYASHRRIQQIGKHYAYHKGSRYSRYHISRYFYEGGKRYQKSSNKKSDQNRNGSIQSCFQIPFVQFIQ